MWNSEVAGKSPAEVGIPRGEVSLNGRDSIEYFVYENSAFVLRAPSKSIFVSIEEIVETGILERKCMKRGAIMRFRLL